MTACSHHGSCVFDCAFAAACAAFATCCGACSAQAGLATKQSPIITTRKTDLALFNTVELPLCPKPQLCRSRLCVLMILQLFRQLKFPLCFFLPAQFPISLPHPLFRIGIVGVHRDGALQGAHSEGGLSFFLQDLSHQNV